MGAGAGGDAPGAALPTDRMGLGAIADRVLDHLAVRRRAADRSRDATLRAHERSLRRFAEYVVASSSDGTLGGAEVMEGYLEALRSRRWPAPKSEAGVPRVVMNHLRAYLEGGAAG